MARHPGRFRLGLEVPILQFAALPQKRVTLS